MISQLIHPMYFFTLLSMAPHGLEPLIHTVTNSHIRMHSTPPASPRSVSEVCHQTRTSTLRVGAASRCSCLSHTAPDVNPKREINSTRALTSASHGPHRLVKCHSALIAQYAKQRRVDETRSASLLPRARALNVEKLSADPAASLDRPPSGYMIDNLFESTKKTY